MKLTFESGSRQLAMENVDEQKINDILEKISPEVFPYVILEKPNGDYIQATGSADRLAVEARFYYEKKFKHFVMGNMEVSKVWNEIHSKVGPIRVLGHEVLKLKDAVSLFCYFYLNGDIDPYYNKRNITKQFIKSSA